MAQINTVFEVVMNFEEILVFMSCKQSQNKTSQGHYQAVYCCKVQFAVI